MKQQKLFEKPKSKPTPENNLKERERQWLKDLSEFDKKVNVGYVKL